MLWSLGSCGFVLFSMLWAKAIRRASRLRWFPALAFSAPASSS
jgi:hypothetical protein